MLYTPDVVQLSVDDKESLFDKAKFDAAIEWLHTQKGYDAKMLNNEPATDLIRETVNIFQDAMDEGIETAVIPPEMEAKLRENIFLFSACKTHQQLTQASALLLNDDGRIKPFEQFAREVTAIHADYNVNYLNTEYNFAVSSSQMASKWVEAEADGDRYNLQYRTADDTQVRESHRLLHNTTLPASDPFWDSYYPPNGWGCRCNVVQVLKSKYETSDPEKAMENGLTSTQQIVAGVDKGAIFRFNPGKSQQIFPPKHPYYKMPTADKAEVDKAAQKQFLKLERQSIKEWAKKELVGTKVSHPQIAAPITFSVTGIKEAINQPHKHYSAKNAAIKRLAKIIPDAKFVKSAPDDSKNEMIVGYHYLETEIAGDKSYIQIEEFKDGRFVFYTITDKIKERPKP